MLIFGIATQKAEQGERLFCLDRQEVHLLLEKKDCKAKKDYGWTDWETVKDKTKTPILSIFVLNYRQEGSREHF